MYPEDAEDALGRAIAKHGGILRPPAGADAPFLATQRLQATFSEGYLRFLSRVANGTAQRDRNGWCFWSAETLRFLPSARKMFGQSVLPEAANPEIYVVLADKSEGEKLLVFRRLRPSNVTPHYYLVSGNKIFEYAKYFEELVRNYESGKGYESATV
ncbi:hypothetical protein [Uliginosibacterium sediminicola]|uniref:Uncharacterized protein n=1 Tax=Uliginosibacterium sediminicola TaxID=2024550 RepID=A0ABU9YXW3_9RHOO